MSGIGGTTIDLRRSWRRINRFAMFNKSSGAQMSNTKFNQTIVSRRSLLLASGTLLLLPLRANRSAAAAPMAVKAYRNPGCGCCEIWATHMQKAGFAVTMEDDLELAARRAGAGVPEEIAGCHTAFVGNYVVEGHVPPEDVLRLLAEKPDARGLAVPGMPMGSPGMDGGSAADPYDVLLFTADAKWSIYASH